MLQGGFAGEVFAIDKSYNSNDNQHSKHGNRQKVKHEFRISHAAVDAYEHILRIARHGHETAGIGSKDFCHQVRQRVKSRAYTNGYDDRREYQNDCVID